MLLLPRVCSWLLYVVSSVSDSLSFSPSVRRRVVVEEGEGACSRVGAEDGALAVTMEIKEGRLRWALDEGDGGAIRGGKEASRGWRTGRLEEVAVGVTRRESGRWVIFFLCDLTVCVVAAVLGPLLPRDCTGERKNLHRTTPVSVPLSGRAPY
jgi:hypothetical protein